MRIDPYNEFQILYNTKLGDLSWGYVRNIKQNKNTYEWLKEHIIQEDLEGNHNLKSTAFEC